LGRECVVCFSIHRDEYDDLRISKRLRIKEIYQYAKTKYNERFSYSAMARHFRNHVKPIIEASIRADKIRKEIIEEEIHKDIQIATTLRKNLETLAKQIELVSEDILNPDDRKEARDVVARINDTVELLLRFSDKIKLEKKESEEDIYDRVIYALEGQNIDWQLFRKRWETFK